jgi:hypothetical protein
VSCVPRNESLIFSTNSKICANPVKFFSDSPWRGSTSPAECYMTEGLVPNSDPSQYPAIMVDDSETPDIRVRSVNHPRDDV